MARESRKFHVGSLELVCMTDGTTTLFPPEFMFKDVSEDDLRSAGVIGATPYTVGFNSLILRSDGKLILVDTGWGDKPSKPFPEAGELMDNFRAGGFRPEEVDIVINTHGHPDHIGWNTIVVDGQIVPTFPNARYYITKSDYDYWTDAEKISPWNADWVQHNLDSLKVLAEMGRLEFADGETSVTSEVRMMPSPGHTVGHSSVLVSSGGQTAVFLGDIAHHPAHLTHPEWVTAFDVLPELQRESRAKLFKLAYEQQALLVQVHNAWPSVAGRLLNKDGETVYQVEEGTGGGA